MPNSAQAPKNREGETGLEEALAHAREELRTLYASLDHVDSGLLILDRDLRSIYSNPALHRLFKDASPQYVRTERPTYESLLRSANEISAVDMKSYVRRRLNWVKSANGRPMDLKMNTGQVVRCSLAILPGGGRMLIYSDITDIARASEELERLATIDDLTGIFNRRHYFNLASAEFCRAKRHGHALSVLMIDIDDFKTINDTYGHHAGDEVIVHLAELANADKRESDLLARIGGEEFVMMLPRTNPHEARAIADRLREAIAITTPSQSVPGITATISVGIAGITGDMTDVSQLMRLADDALYVAKRGGRNRVVFAGDTVDSPPMTAG